MANLINLTPHPLVVYDDTGENVLAQVPTSGITARVVTRASEVGTVTVEGTQVPVVSMEYGEIKNLPGPKEETFCIVSILVISALKALGEERNDVLAPDTGLESVVRDKDGRIQGVRRFTR